MNSRSHYQVRRAHAEGYTLCDKTTKESIDGIN
jgi:hypothetical protein